MDTATRVQILDATDSISHSTNTLGKGMNPIILPLAMVWFVGFYGISTFIGYLTPNPFLCKWSVLFKTIQFSISTQFNGQKHFHF